MKTPAVTEIRTGVKLLNPTSRQPKQSNLPDVKTIKTYAQYMRVYGLKK